MIYLCFSLYITGNSGRLLKRDWNEICFLFFRDLGAPGQSLNALLMKFARSSTDVTGVKVYNSKKPTWGCFEPELHCAVNIEAVQLSELRILRSWSNIWEASWYIGNYYEWINQLAVHFQLANRVNNLALVLYMSFCEDLKCRAPNIGLKGYGMRVKMKAGYRITWLLLAGCWMCMLIVGMRDGFKTDHRMRDKKGKSQLQTLHGELWL